MLYHLLVQTLLEQNFGTHFLDQLLGKPILTNHPFVKPPFSNSRFGMPSRTDRVRRRPEGSEDPQGLQEARPFGEDRRDDGD